MNIPPKPMMMQSTKITAKLIARITGDIVTVSLISSSIRYESYICLSIYPHTPNVITQTYHAQNPIINMANGR